MTTVSPAGTAFVGAAGALAAHLADHTLPEPALLAVTTRYGRSELRVQLRSHTLAGIAADLLAWAQTLSAVTAGVLRMSAGDWAQLSIASTLTGPAGEAVLDVHGGCVHDPVLITDLPPGGTRTVPLEQLHSWAAMTSAVTGDGGMA
ncbi:MAG TPA: hypothetical protein VFO16_00090 [Pseudonocardiaceae bacterium]|nr:hypothetical protein [Pseudonocardiaceae bacterium]